MTVKKKARVIQKAPKAGKVRRSAARAAAQIVTEGEHRKIFKKAINKALKNYLAAIDGIVWGS
jgi:hypothetical protein